MGHRKANRQKSRWHRYLEVSISPTCRISPSPPNNPHNTSPCLSPSLLPWSLAVMLLWLHSKGYAVYPPSLPVTPPPPAATHTHTQTHSISPKSCQRNTVRRITNVSTVCICRENVVANSNLLQTAPNSTTDEVSVFVNMCDSHTHTQKGRRNVHVKKRLSVFVWSRFTVACGIEMLLTQNSTGSSVSHKDETSAKWEHVRWAQNTLHSCNTGDRI